MPLPVLDRNVDKNSRGTVLIAGGSAVSPGAVTLSGLGAFRAGAGKVLLAVPDQTAMAIAAGFPEAGMHAVASTRQGDPDPGQAAAQIGELLRAVDVTLIGPGLAHEANTRALTHELLAIASGGTWVIDALSLSGLWDEQAALRRFEGRVVLTPHAGEMAQLMNVPIEQVNADPYGHALQTARRLHCVVVLKGAMTVIADADGSMFFHDAEIGGLATSGSGDVLAGILGGLISRGASPVTAALWAVYLHAQAGRVLSQRLGPVGLLARELPQEVPALMVRLSREAAPTVDPKIPG